MAMNDQSRIARAICCICWRPPPWKNGTVDLLISISVRSDAWARYSCCWPQSSSANRSIKPLANPAMMGTGPAVVSAKAVSAIATLGGCAVGDGGRIGWWLYALAGTVCVVTGRVGRFIRRGLCRLYKRFLLSRCQPGLITDWVAMKTSRKVPLIAGLLNLYFFNVRKFRLVATIVAMQTHFVVPSRCRVSNFQPLCVGQLRLIATVVAVQAGIVVLLGGI